jgi:hypothetical protein
VTSEAYGLSIVSKNVRPLNVMLTIAQDAQRISLLFEYGVVSGTDVVGWSDSVILQMDSPPYELIELSLTAPDKTADIMSHLHQLSAGSDFWSALRSAMPQIRNFVVARPEQASSIAHHLFFTAVLNPDNVPKDLSFMFRYDDEFWLAEGGIHRDPETVHRNFIHELSKFAPAA